MALATLADVQAFRTVAPEGEAAATTFLSMAEGWIVSEVGCDMTAATRTERLSGNGSAYLFPSYWPITAVTSIAIESLGVTLTVLEGTAADTNQEVWLPSHGMWLEMRQGVINPGWLGAWPVGSGNIKLVYTAGYSTVPDDLTNVVVMLTHLLLDERKRLGKGSMNVGGESVGGVVRKLEEYPFIEATIAKYRRPALGY